MEGPARVSRTPGPSRLRSITFAGPAGSLEGLLVEDSAREPALTAVVCHPHPSHGGTMHNKVVHRVASTLHGLGASVLRFNFRGVGASAGVYDRGVGELEDARAACEWMRSHHPRARRWLAGFSFGSWVAAQLAASEPAIEQLILVAPPVASEDFSALERATMPKWIVQGTADTHCPLPALEQAFPRWADPKLMLRVEGATHFFDKQLGALSDVLLQALSGPAHNATS